MTPFARFKLARGWAAVAGPGIMAITGAKTPAQLKTLRPSELQ